MALLLLASMVTAEVVVESLPPGSALARAGVEPGDVLESWIVDGADPISIDTPFTFETLRLEEAPQGSLELHGKRDGDAVSFVVEPGYWAAEVRPAMTQAELLSWATVRQSIENGRFEETLVSAGQAVSAGRKAGGWELESGWWLRTGELLADARAFDAAHTAYRNAEKAARDKIAQATVAYAFGRLGRARNDLEAAEKAHRKILALYGTDASAPLVVARSHTQLGKIAWARGEVNKMGEHYRKALALTQTAAPWSYALGQCLNNVSYLAYVQGELKVAESQLKRAHRLLVELAPLSNQLGTTLYYRGVVELAHSRLTAAQRYFHKALDIAETLAPTGRDLVVAHRYRAMSQLERWRGDFTVAEEYARRALSVEIEEIPGSWQLALTLSSLADILNNSGREESAQQYYRQALAILENLGNDFMFAFVLGNLADLLARRGKFEEAEDLFRQTLEIHQEKTPGSSTVSWALLQLGQVAFVQGDFLRAEAYFQEAVALLEEQAPNHTFLAHGLIFLGDLARQRDRLGDAEQFYRRALGVYGDVQAGLIEEQARHGLGLTLSRRGQLSSAAAELQQAVAALEDQLRRLGGAHHDQAIFRAQNRDIYDDALAAELAAGRPDQAFHLLERSRARSLLKMLTERDLDFSLDLPEELVTARHDLKRRYREAMEEARKSGDEALFQEKLVELARLHEEQGSLEARLRRTSPRYATLRYPTPHGVSEVRRSLDPGTVLLAYNVAQERTDLFVVTPEDGLVDVMTLQVGSSELRQKVEGYLRLLKQRRHPQSLTFRSFMEASRELYDLLIAPAEQAIEGGMRLLIVPDGALHQLPFAALVRPTDDYLVEWRPLHTVLSATLYAQLRAAQPAADQPATPVKVAAFGDPLYPSWIRKEPGEITEPRVGSVVRSGLFNWDSLPHTRREVEGLAELYPRKDVFLHLGARATEEAIHSLEPGTEIVHIAVHGHLDDRFPLNSALALTIPERVDETYHDGLLQAWEIFDSVRLDADLVVLSACSTALGQERGGEGLVGLVHAFHYAGARSILASLWNVNDRVTAELMIRFHQHLRDGLAKDEALRAAQLELLQAPIEMEDAAGKRILQDAAAPYYWAAFRILGNR